MTWKHDELVGLIKEIKICINLIRVNIMIVSNLDYRCVRIFELLWFDQFYCL